MFGIFVSLESSLEFFQTESERFCILPDSDWNIFEFFQSKLNPFTNTGTRYKLKQFCFFQSKTESLRAVH